MISKDSLQINVKGLHTMVCLALNVRTIELGDEGWTKAWLDGKFWHFDIALLLTVRIGPVSCFYDRQPHQTKTHFHNNYVYMLKQYILIWFQPVIFNMISIRSFWLLSPSCLCCPWLWCIRLLTWLKAESGADNLIHILGRHQIE